MNHLILLHGALGSRVDLDPLRELLSDAYDVDQLDFSGHGGTPFHAEPFSIRLFADEVAQWMRAKGIDSADIVGYSMGGYVGLYLARHSPSLVGSVATFATKFRWNEETARKEAAMLDPAKIRQKVPAFAAQLAARHTAETWERVVRDTAAMLLELGSRPALGAGDLKAVTRPILVSVGDRDAMVSVDETVEAFRALANGALLILPSTAHAIDQAPFGRLSDEIKKFFAAQRT